jgi:hypothetical protein
MGLGLTLLYWGVWSAVMWDIEGNTTPVGNAVGSPTIFSVSPPVRPKLTGRPCLYVFNSDNEDTTMYFYIVKPLVCPMGEP